MRSGIRRASLRKTLYSGLGLTLLGLSISGPAAANNLFKDNTWYNCNAMDSAPADTALTVKAEECFYQEARVRANRTYSFYCDVTDRDGDATATLTFYNRRWRQLTTAHVPITGNRVSVTLDSPRRTRFVGASIYAEQHATVQNCNLILGEAPPLPVVPLNPIDPGATEIALAENFYSCSGGSADRLPLAISGEGCYYQEYALDTSKPYTFACSVSAQGYADIGLQFVDEHYNAVDSTEMQVSNGMATVTLPPGPANARYLIPVVYASAPATFNACRLTTPAVDNPPVDANDNARSESVDTLVAALESYATQERTYRVFGGGFQSGGDGYINFIDGGDFPQSIANILIAGGHLSDPAPLDPLYTPDNPDFDFISYLCNDRVAVFAKTDSLLPGSEDASWWAENSCTRFAIDGLGYNYFSLSRSTSELDSASTVPTADDLLRATAVDKIVAAMESFGAANQSYNVQGAGFQGFGEGYFHFVDGVDFPDSFANVLAAGGHLPELPVDPANPQPGTSTDHDFLVYQCGTRVGIFADTDAMIPSFADSNWWETNNCGTFPIDPENGLGYRYFTLTKTLPNVASSCQSNQLLIEGDSISQGNPTIATWTNYLGLSFTNLATDSATLVDTMAPVFANELSANAPCYQSIVLIGGVNDIAAGHAAGASPVASMQSAMQSMVAAAGTTPMIISTITPFGNSFFDTAQTRGWADQYNSWILTSNWPANVQVLDVLSLLDADGNGVLDPDYLSNADRIHPNGAGSSVVAQAVEDLVANGLTAQ